MRTVRKTAKNKNSQGYAILELIFYISFFAVLSIAVISSMLTMSRSFKETAIYLKASRGAEIIERMVRETRNANAINTISTTSLKLNTTNGAGVATTVEFTLAGTDIELRENNSLIGDLDAPNITIESLSFTEITTTAGKAIKMQLSVSLGDDPLNRTFDFYDTVVLRGSY